ncbi:hypothetical protein D3C84_765740 [compost metagenome]
MCHRPHRAHRRRAGGHRASYRPAGAVIAGLVGLSPASSWRAVPAEHDQSGVVRQPLFRTDWRIRRARRRASTLAGDRPVMGADLLHSGAPSGVSFCWLSSCRCAQPPVQPSNVQGLALNALGRWPSLRSAGGLTASSNAPPGRRGLERRRQAKAEGKTKGGGTWVPATPVCTWGRSGTARFRRRAVYGAQRALMLACPRASHTRTRPGLPREQP